MKNINELVSYLKDTLHISIGISNNKLNFTKSIPLAIKNNYDIYNIKLQNIDTVFLSTNEENVRSIKKHLNLFEQSLSIPIVLHIGHISNSTKRYLIENGIPFVSEQSIYLPQLLIHFNDFNEKYKNIKNKKLSKLAQTILISLISNKQNQININDSAVIFNVTKMSTSRALKELADFEYLEVKHIGRGKEYFLKYSIDIEKLFIELKNPVMDSVYIKFDDLSYFNKKVLTSFSALSRYANITSNKPIYAIEKDYFNKIIKKDNQITIYDKEYDNNLIQIELWRYNPQLTNEDLTDPISLYLSLKDKIDIYDFRANDAMAELYNKIKGMLN